MKLPLRTAEAAEQNALRAAPPTPPEPAGPARYRAQLAGDPGYRAALGAALGLSLSAGVEFVGHAFDEVGPDLWAATAAILIARVLDGGVGGSTGKIPGRAPALTMALAAAAATVLVSLRALTRILDPDGFRPWNLVTPLAFGAVVAIAAALGAWRWAQRVATWGLAAAWLIAAASGHAQRPPALAAAGVLAALDLLLSRRPGFANAIAVVAFLHLGGLLFAGGGDLPSGLHIAAAWVEAALLVYAGLRDLDAAQWIPPRATYRAAPLSVVPRLDRAQDHPVRIDLA